jgi:hypothetical protein
MTGADRITEGRLALGGVIQSQRNLSAATLLGVYRSYLVEAGSAEPDSKKP